jgi:N-acetylmuramic acid 6-phosphate etherase
MLIAGGHEALVRSVEGVEDDAGEAQTLAKHRGALTIAIANNPHTPLLAEADHPIWLDTGPEPIAGSTRMKAGTAQRIALNLLSSLVMIGRVYRGLMVDLEAVKQKADPA